MTRRTDLKLRSAINVLEGMHLSQPRAESVLSRALQELMQLLDIDYGYCYYCAEPDAGGVPWNLCGVFIRRAGELVAQEMFATSYEVAPNWLPRFQSGRGFFENDAAGQCLDFQPKNHPDIKNYLCVPVVDARYLHGIIVLCNRNVGFDQAVVQRLRPFLAAAGCLLRVVRQRPVALNSSRDDGELVDAREAPQFVSKLLDAMFNAVLVIGDKDDIILGNNTAAELFGLDKSKLVGEPLKRFVPRSSPQIQERLQPDTPFKDAISKANTMILRGVEVCRVDNEKRLVDIQCYEIPMGAGFIRGLVFNDISERIQSNTDYLSTLQRFQVLTTLAPVGILQLNRNWQCTYANDTWCAYSQITLDETMGVGWLNAIHKEDLEPSLNALRGATAYTGRFEREFRLQSPLGKITWVKVNACSLYDEMGDTSGVIMTFNDISDHRSNEVRLRKMAETDQLTGLVNRTFFYDRVELAVSGSARYGSVALMFIDLDDFKHVNDTLGHDMGDKLLQDVALRLRHEIRDVDTLARLGGDEFTVLLTHIKNTKVVATIAQKLIDALRKPFAVGERSIYVTCSIGIAVTSTKESSKQLLKQADIALYRAKGMGRNQYRFYSPAMDRDASLHIQLRESLQDRDRCDFSLVFQPIIDAQSNEVISIEALARWQYPGAEGIGPERFIKMIEESGLLHAFGDWLFDSVFSQIKDWKASSLFFDIPKISINLSAKQLRNKKLPHDILEKSLQYDVLPEEIVFEVTETALIDDTELAVGVLMDLNEKGFEISLDDFGVGFSSLSYLRDMPINTVKIDRSFIVDVLKDEEDAKIVAAIINLAQALNLRTIAEGVDATDIRHWLLDHDCVEHQGFLYHKPMMASEIESLLMDNMGNTVDRAAQK